MEQQRVNIDLALNEAVPVSELPRETILAELRRCREQAAIAGYTLTDLALNEIADAIVANAKTPDLGALLAQLIKERAKPTERKAGRLFIDNHSGQNRKQRRAAQAAARRVK